MEKAVHTFFLIKLAFFYNFSVRSTPPKSHVATF